MRRGCAWKMIYGMNLHAFEAMSDALVRATEAVRNGSGNETYPSLLAKLTAEKKRLLVKMKSMTKRLEEYNAEQSLRDAQRARIEASIRRKR